MSSVGAAERALPWAGRALSRASHPRAGVHRFPLRPSAEVRQAIGRPPPQSDDLDRARGADPKHQHANYDEGRQRQQREQEATHSARIARSSGPRANDARFSARRERLGPMGPQSLLNAAALAGYAAATAGEAGGAHAAIEQPAAAVRDRTAVGVLLTASARDTTTGARAALVRNPSTAAGRGRDAHAALDDAAAPSRPRRTLRSLACSCEACSYRHRTGSRRRHHRSLTGGDTPHCTRCRNRR